MNLSNTIRRYPFRSLAVVVGLYMLMHLPFVNLPPCSIHVWRQCNTLAVARNFFEESSNIFQPRIDRRGLSDGVTGMQFPAYEWVLSRIYFVTGEHYAIQRLFALMISSMGIIAMFFFLRKIARDSFYGILGAWCLAWSPEFFYHGMNALPDMMALTAAIYACYLFLRWTYRGGRKLYWATFLLMTIAGLIKIQYFMIIAFMAGTLLMMQRFSFKNIFHGKLLQLTLMAILSGGIIASWYIYARNLIKISGLKDFVIEVRSAESVDAAIIILKRNLISDFPELLINYGSIIFVIAALILIGKRRLQTRPAVLGFILLALAYFSYHVLELHQMRVHQYYMLPSLIFFIPLAAAGAALMYAKEKLRLVMTVALISLPILCAIRIIPARWIKSDLGIPTELADAASLQRLQNAVPKNKLVAVGPDPSGCIFFYFLDKKGYSFSHASKLQNEKFPGAEYLYLYKSALPEGYKEILIEGDWSVGVRSEMLSLPK
jgi:4-amino-4-deoxy-L-arabinose transferase-like glycosyltransferase